MSWRKPERGLVINYSYLWAREAKLNREEGRKDRPCAIVVARYDDPDRIRVRVLPVTHTPPDDPRKAIEIPAVTRARLGLDSERSWIVLDEVNDFNWPGHDVRTIGQSGSPYYGPLPPSFFDQILEKLRKVRVQVVKRT
jgi:hypothetical protein